MQSKKTSTLAPYGSLKLLAIASKVGVDGKGVGSSLQIDQRQVVRRNKTK